jgi:hypothetical protein
VPAKADHVRIPVTMLYDEERQKPPEPTPAEWCRCGCGGEGRCIANRGAFYAPDLRDAEPNDDHSPMVSGILAVMRMPLKP